ncbi:MAG: hypothetical protein QHI38_04255 [Armatimonadota bacterium]|nr:hypothetical protein [Armatimonadota bacterium]
MNEIGFYLKHILSWTILLLFACAVCARQGQQSADNPGKTEKFLQAPCILPPSALDSRVQPEHPLAGAIRTFLDRQPSCQIEPTGLTRSDYLRILERQVEAWRKWQNEEGAIIDPIEKIEWQYSTPCYAFSVALLAAAHRASDPSLVQSGIKAMDRSVDEMHEYRTAHNHGEFFIQPVMLALELFEGLAPQHKIEEWKRKIAELDPYRLYPDNLRRKQTCYNHNVVCLAGEYLRAKKGLGASKEFFERHLEHHVQYFNDFGMYKDPNVPMVYDEFSRQFLTTILAEGYEGPLAGFYRDRLWRGAWTSLFMQSPFGECPTGGRSAQHIWNEAQTAVTYEIYASQYAKQGKLAEAGAFKRAAHLAVNCIRRWLKPDGTGYVVKNRYPPEARHGYESYSAQSQYNLLACWLLGVAYLYADDSISERPCPADVGGFAFSIPDFHKVFANAAGTYVEYETAGDLRYNPTGLIRCHIRGSNPQLGPSDGIVHKFEPKTKKDLGGENMCVGPAWLDSAGVWHRLADYSPDTPPDVQVLHASPDRVSFRITYTGKFDGAHTIRETITLEPGMITVEDVVSGTTTEKMRIYYPMLVFDGLEESRITVGGSSAMLELRDGSCLFEILEPQEVRLQRTWKRLDFRNGQAEGVYAEIDGLRAVYRIRAVRKK